VIAMTGLMLVAVFLLAGANASNPYLAVGLLSLCFGCTQLTEGPYWSAVTYASGEHTSVAAGVMNTGGNAAGFLAPLVGLMVDHLGWLSTLASGSVFAVIAAALWLLIRVQRDPPLVTRDSEVLVYRAHGHSTTGGRTCRPVRRAGRGRLGLGNYRRCFGCECALVSAPVACGRRYRNRGRRSRRVVAGTALRRAHDT
jgi:MFS family permease